MMVLNLLIKPLAIFGIDAQVQNQVGSDDYGIYFSLLNFSFLFNILMDFGINNFTTKSVAQAPKATVTYLGKILLFRLVLFVFYAVVTFSIALVVNWNVFELQLLSLLVLNQFFVTLIAYARSHFGGLLMFRTDAVLSILDKALLIIFCGLLLYTPIAGETFRIEWLVYTQTVCYGLTFLLAMGMLFSRIGIPKISYKHTFTYAIVRKSAPYALLILLMMIYTRVDSVMIERMHPDGRWEAGYYAQGFRLLDACFMFAMIFSNLLLPLFSRMLSKKEDVSPVLSVSGRWLISGAMTLATIAFFHGEQILSWIYDQDIYESAPAFRLLMVALVGMCVSLIFGTLLTANGSLKFLNSVSTLGILVNIGLNLFLIPEYGAIGAAFATMVTQAAVAVSQVIYSVYTFGLRPSIPMFLKFLLLIGAIVGVEFLIPGEIYTIWIRVFIATLLLFVLRLIDLKQLIATLRNSEEEEIPS